MPLDGHSFLVAQGWSGKGTGLRQGAITRPITVSQKKTLSGIGKDRDEAFPFWDHLFSAAAKSIQVKITSSDEEDDSDEDTPSAPTLKRTTTGILSNKRPIDGIPATPDPSGSSTPLTTPTQRLSLLSLAKREAAKRGLYSKFFRGPVLGPDPSFALPSPSPTPAPSIPTTSIDESGLKTSDKGKGKTKEEKALKRQHRAEKAERRERKRLKLQARAVESDAESEKVARKRKRNSAEQNETSSTADAGVKKKKRHRKVEVTDEATDEPPRKKKRKRDL